MVSWVRLRAEPHDTGGPGSNGEVVAPDGFQELDSTEQVMWVEKPKRGG